MTIMTNYKLKGTHQQAFRNGPCESHTNPPSSVSGIAGWRHSSGPAKASRWPTQRVRSQAWRTSALFSGRFLSTISWKPSTRRWNLLGWPTHPAPRGSQRRCSYSRYQRRWKRHILCKFLHRGMVRREAQHGCQTVLGSEGEMFHLRENCFFNG